METIENKRYISSDDVTNLVGARYINCKFNLTTLPSFASCQFHNCIFVRCKVDELLNCKFWACKFDECDFTEADVRYSQTESASPTIASNCKMAGIAAINDCRWWAGLSVDDATVYDILTLCLLPISVAKQSVYKSIPDKFRGRVASLLRRPLRK